MAAFSGQGVQSPTDTENNLCITVTFYILRLEVYMTASVNQ